MIARCSQSRIDHATTPHNGPNSRRILASQVQSGGSLGLRSTSFAMIQYTRSILGLIGPATPGRAVVTNCQRRSQGKVRKRRSVGYLARTAPVMISIIQVLASASITVVNSSSTGYCRMATDMPAAWRSRKSRQT